MVELLESLRRRYDAKSLCLAGGLFLNPLIVSEAEKRTGFEKTYVQPAAGNGERRSAPPGSRSTRSKTAAIRTSDEIGLGAKLFE